MIDKSGGGANRDCRVGPRRATLAVVADCQAKREVVWIEAVLGDDRAHESARHVPLVDTGEGHRDAGARLIQRAAGQIARAEALPEPCLGGLPVRLRLAPLARGARRQSWRSACAVHDRGEGR